MSVKIIADSGCDLSVECAMQEGIDLVPFHVLFCEEGTVREYIHNEDLTTEQFYEKLCAAKEYPRTCQPSPCEFLKAFKRNAPYDEIVCLTVTSKMAGTYDSACRAAELYAEEAAKCGGAMPVIHLFDTQNCSGGATLLALHAADLAKKGKNASEIIASLTELRQRVSSLFVLNSFVYALKSGRTCGIKPVLGELFGVKPVFTFKDGLVTDVSRISRANQVQRYLVDTFQKTCKDHSMAVIFHAMAKDRAFALEKELKALYPNLRTMILSVGAVVGVFAGPGCIGISFFKEEEQEQARQKSAV